jgi:hypothetical protein
MFHEMFRNIVQVNELMQFDLTSRAVCLDIKLRATNEAFYKCLIFIITTLTLI